MSDPYDDMWLPPDEDPRTDAGASDERGVVLDYLRNYRLTFELKCAGLDAEQLARRSVPPSSLSLLGLLRHLAKVECSWFRRTIGGADTPLPYAETRDADFDGAVADDEVVEEAWSRWRAEVAHAEQVLETEHDLGRVVRHHDDEVVVRDVLVHMVEEYARHVGHADLLRECIDGRTGQ